ncbi:MAG: competence damage-inducible protein A [Candidatus Heimdallarchaeota archaeon]|nr:competence damage-inducible protein A [Candidatus Heimdallarchaeota archaeon]
MFIEKSRLMTMILPTAEIVCLGNELLIGVTVNTNGTFMGEKLTQLGYEVRRITCIRDDLELASAFFKEAFLRKPDVIVVSGGLGPTYDDIQMEVLGAALAVPLIENNQALQQLETYYERRNLGLTKERRKMALFPEGATILSNSVGGAPGCHIEHEGMDIFSVPGVPPEMKDILLNHIIPILRAKVDNNLYELKFQLLNCIESELAPHIQTVKTYYPDLYIKSHPANKAKGGIVIHISGYGETAEKSVSKARKELQVLFKKEKPSIEIKEIKE